MTDRKAADGLQFNQELIALIRKRYPKALEGDIEQNAKCADALTIAIGGLVAFAFRLNGQVVGRTVLQAIIKRIVNDADAINAGARENIRKSLPTILN